MELQERYIAAGLKHIPPAEKDEVEKAMRRIIAERLQERGDPSEETEREVLRGLGSPRILAEKQLKEPPHLIGPELYGTYFMIVKIVMTVAVIGTLIGNTVDFIVNDAEPCCVISPISFADGNQCGNRGFRVGDARVRHHGKDGKRENPDGNPGRLESG